MAKDVEREDDDKFEKMDDESLGFLEQVRKGKMRNFVLSMKGAKVRSMIVKKKPIKDKDRKAARGEGFQPVYGVASGMGAKITFTVARSDGFDEKAADCKTEKLKKFLSSQTGKVFKPTFELVDAPPPIPFDDEDLNDPLIARFMALEPTIVQACDEHADSVSLIQASVNMIRDLLQDEEKRPGAGAKIDELEQYLANLMAGNAAIPPAPPPPPGTPDPAAAFKARLQALLPRIKQAVGTPAGDEAKLRASEAGVFARKQEFPQANESLDQAESLLDQPAAAPTASRPDDAEQAKKLAEALKRLKPLVDKVLNADPNRKEELYGTMARIAGDIKTKQFETAKQEVTELAALLKSLAAQTPEPSAADTGDALSAFTARRAALEPRLLEAQRADPEKATKLGAVWNYADEQAHAENVANANKALDRLETAINAVLAAPPASDAERFGIQEGLVAATRDALAKSKLRWDKGIADAQAELGKVKQQLAPVDPELANELDEVLFDYRVGLDDILKAGQKVQDDDEADKHRQQALSLVKSLRKEVAADQVVAYLDTCEDVKVRLRATLEMAFMDIEQQLVIKT